MCIRSIWQHIQELKCTSLWTKHRKQRRSHRCKRNHCLYVWKATGKGEITVHVQDGKAKYADGNKQKGVSIWLSKLIFHMMMEENSEWYRKHLQLSRCRVLICSLWQRIVSYNTSWWQKIAAPALFSALPKLQTIENPRISYCTVVNVPSRCDPCCCSQWSSNAHKALPVLLLGYLNFCSPLLVPEPPPTKVVLAGAWCPPLVRRGDDDYRENQARTE